MYCIGYGIRTRNSSSALVDYIFYNQYKTSANVPQTLQFVFNHSDTSRGVYSVWCIFHYSHYLRSPPITWWEEIAAWKCQFHQNNVLFLEPRKKTMCGKNIDTKWYKFHILTHGKSGKCRKKTDYTLKPGKNNQCKYNANYLALTQLCCWPQRLYNVICSSRRVTFSFCHICVQMGQMDSGSSILG